MITTSENIVRIQGGKASSRRPLVSLIVPVFNEQDSVPVFLDRLAPVIAGVRGEIDFETLFVNDGSQDATERVLDDIAGARPDVAIVHLSRNFGKEAALFAGLAHARGDAVIPLDVDLQDPPEIIPEMIARWRAGAQVVNARRACRDRDGWAKRVTSGAFYRIFNALAEHPIPRDVGDFRLLDRAVVDAVRQLGERSRFNKALFSWVGFKTEEVTYDRPSRAVGDSRWTYWRLWKLALDGIFASSTTPLRIWSYIGAVMALASLVYSGFLFLRVLLFGIDVPGYASTAILILVFGGMNMLALGIIGEYVGRIYIEVRQRPLYVVRSQSPARREAQHRGP